MVENRMLTAKQVEQYVAWLGREERSKGTREKYQRDLTEFRTWLHGMCVDKERVTQWKHQLLEQGYAPVTVNSKLCRKLLKYAKQCNIRSGEIFITRTGKSLSRRQIWAEMKALCEKAGVEPSKVFPHNLRHLFATVFYRSNKDISKLADVLGHSSIETTRIYLIASQRQHARYLEGLGFVS